MGNTTKPNPQISEALGKSSALEKSIIESNDEPPSDTPV